MGIFDSFKKKNTNIKAPDAKPGTPAKKQETTPGGWKVRDIIAGRYEIHQILGGPGKSGMGIVYICNDSVARRPVAVKTFQDKFWSSIDARKAFYNEALLWIQLENHPHVVQAYSTDNVMNRQLIILEYIAADENNRNCLSHYLNGKPLPVELSLEWAIQFCLGMEYALGKGIYSHNDIKPDNIMITSGGILKITDFGLAQAMGQSGIITDDAETEEPGLTVFRRERKAICGTPGYMAPEVVYGEGMNVRSDIYSFGVVLYQMASGSPRHPFNVMWNGNAQEYILAIYEKQMKEELPEVDSPLWPVIKRCLDKEPEMRGYKNFKELREELELILNRETGKTYRQTSVEKPGTTEMTNRMVSFFDLKNYPLAVKECDNLLKTDPNNSDVHRMRGLALYEMGKYEEAIQSLNKSIKIDPMEPYSHFDLGLALREQGNLEEARKALERSVDLNPNFFYGYGSLAIVLDKLNRTEEAVASYKKAININPEYTEAYGNLAICLEKLGRIREAERAYEEAIKIDPSSYMLHYNKANMLYKQKKYEDAAESFQKTINFNPDFGEAYCNLGAVLLHLGKIKEAEAAFEDALKLNPDDSIASNNLSLVRRLL